MQMGEYKKRQKCLNGRSLNAPIACMSALPYSFSQKKKMNIHSRSQIYALFGRAISRARWQLMVEQPVMDI